LWAVHPHTTPMAKHIQSIGIMVSWNWHDRHTLAD
jgi:hypothetical protein